MRQQIDNERSIPINYSICRRSHSDDGDNSRCSPLQKLPGFYRAAQALGSTKSSVSTRIKALEPDLGIVAFDLDTRGEEGELGSK